MSVLSKVYFHDEARAFEYLENVLWPNGPICPHCGAVDRITSVQGRTARLGLKRCGHCKCQFTVKVGTVFESAHIPLNKMLQAVYLLTCSKKGFSAHQLHRVLQITYKSAWFLAHRVREAMKAGTLPPLGGNLKAVEADETFIGRKKDRSKKRGYAHKHAVLSLVERGGRIQSFHVPRVNAETLKPILRAQIKLDSMFMTDEAAYYRGVGGEFRHHFAVEHGIGEYVRGGAHTNTLEGYFSIFKRGMKGVYQHCSAKHLRRYLAEFDFRYNERTALGIGDEERADRTLGGIVGKRLLYRDSSTR